MPGSAPLFPAFAWSRASVPKAFGMLFPVMRGVEQQVDGDTIRIGPGKLHVLSPTFGVWTSQLWSDLHLLQTEATELLAALVAAAAEALELASYLALMVLCVASRPFYLGRWWRQACIMAGLYLLSLVQLARPPAPIAAEPDPLALPRVLSPGGWFSLFIPIC